MDIFTAGHSISSGIHSRLTSEIPWALLVGMAASVPGLGPPLGASAASAGAGRCQVCGGAGHTQHVTFNRNLGMLVMRRTYRLEGDLCRSCIHRTYWKFTGLNLLLGPWGMISLIMTPVYFFSNLAAYVGALYKMRGAVA